MSSAQTKCLILDVAMPGMTGPDLQRELASRRQAIPIVFITASGDTAIRTRVLADGAVECLFKPFSETALLDALNAALRIRGSYDENDARRPSRARHIIGSAIGPRSIELVTMPDLTPIVFVVDDDVSVRESLELLIASAGWRPETFASGQDFLSRPACSVPCCLVLDVTLPGAQRSGAAAAARRADRHADHLHYRTRRRTDDRAGDEGGSRRVPDKTLASTMCWSSAIRGALERSRAALRLDAEMRELRNCYESLTPREREVMALVVSGLLNKQVGGELGISEITVKAHRGQVMRKMKADSLPDLVTMAARLGLRSTPARS